MRLFFSKESIIWWVITSYRGKKKRYRELLKTMKAEKPASKELTFLTFSRPKETAAFLERLQRPR